MFILYLNHLKTVLLSLVYEYSVWHSFQACKSTRAITTVYDKLLMIKGKYYDFKRFYHCNPSLLKYSEPRDC